MLGPRTRRVLSRVALAGGSLILALGLGEGIARVAENARAPSGPDFPDTGPLYEHDPVYGWRKRPGVTVEARTSEYRTTVSTNTLGMRGRETTREKPPGTTRVLLLGDSFLEGYTVNAQDVVSTQLEAALAGAASGPVEVLNAGTAGYSTDQELLHFIHEGRQLEPDVTVLLFYRNDVYYNVMRSYWRGRKPYFELADSGLALRGVPVTPPDPGQSVAVDRGGPAAIRILRRLDRWLAPRSALMRLASDAAERSPTISGLAVRLGAVDVPGEHWPWRRELTPAAAQAWDLTEALILRMRDEVRAAGSGFVVFFVPSRPVVDEPDWRRTRRAYAMSEEEWSPTADAERLRGLCVRAVIECIIPIEEFRADADRLSPDERLYFERDDHWTAAGHRLAARLIAEHLRGSL